jgi:hypothetical protein
MTNETIKHKLKVFISSKCGGKYEIARKALEKLLTETGLIECFCFETEPGSAESMPSAYLDRIHLYQILLLIVDNEDNITNATLSEYRKAKELGLKIIAIFCNETKKDKTEVEKEIIENGSCLFVTAVRFSDIAIEAYRSVMQDMVYASTPKQNIEQNIAITEDTRKAVNINNIQISKSFLNDFVLTKHTIYDSILNSKQEQQPTEIDGYFQTFLQVILCNKPFDAVLFDKVKNVILEKHLDELKEIISMRLDAVKLYFLGDINNCVEVLNKIIKRGNGLPSIPKWLVNDVAIDLRNMSELKSSINGQICIDNRGQAIIDSSNEFLYFPAIDRIANNIKKNVIKEYSKINLQSPYTNSLGGGLEYVFSDIASYFCTALMYGSITHIRLTRNYIADILEVLSQEYSNQEFHSELVRYLVILVDDKKIQNILRIYKSQDIVGSIDLQKVIQSISYLPTEYDRTQSLLILLKHFGYFLSDEQFATLLKWFLEFTHKWIQDDNRNSYFADYMEKVFSNCCERIPSKVIIDFILALFEKENYRLNAIACKLIGSVKIKELTQEKQEIISKCFEKLIADKNAHEQIPEMCNAIIIFALNTSISLSSLEEALKLYMKSFYDNSYCLELYVKDIKTSLVQIMSCVSSIQTRASQQGKNGYIGYADNPFDTINNIVKINKIKLNWTEVKPIIEAVSNFVLSPNQSSWEKSEAITLLTTLTLTYPQLKSVKNVIADIITKKDDILNVFHLNIFHANIVPTLSFALDYLGFLIGVINPIAIISSLSNISAMSDRNIIASMKYLSLSLSLGKSDLDNFPIEVLSSILQLSISLLENNERDIRFFAVKCLIELTHSKYQELALKQLSICMDSGSSDIRMAIISRIKQIRDNSSIRDHIIQKAMTDNHFVVREIAKDIREN